MKDSGHAEGRVYKKRFLLKFSEAWWLASLPAVKPVAAETKF